MKIYINKKICIVGTGFCGYTAYKKLAEENVDLLIIEGGDIKTPISSDEQYFYKVSTNNYVSSIKTKEKKIRVKNGTDPSFTQRKYTVGGSSECWSGWIKPFEESTYRNEYISWPYKWGDLNLIKQNKESLKILNSPILDFDPLKLAESLNLELPLLPKGLFYTVYSFSNSPLRLKNYWLDKSTDNPKKVSSKKNLLYGYRLIDALFSDNKVDALIFSNDKDTLFVKAEVFILGLGGIENARFAKKLSFNKDIPKSFQRSIGNFQEHVQIEVGGFNYGKNLMPKVIRENIPIYSQGNKTGEIKFMVGAWDGVGTPKVTFELIEMIKWRKKNILDFYKYKFLEKPYFDFKIYMRCEQTPNNKSKLDFSNQTTNLNWNVLEKDFKIYSEYLKRVVSFLSYSDYLKDFALVNDSKFNESIDHLSIPKRCDGCAHHMGTFAYNESNSLIDEKFKHKIFQNMYFVGSSVFPISGFENPTHASIATTLVAVEDIKNNYSLSKDF